MSKIYEVTFVPIGSLSYTYTVDAKDEDTAYDDAKQELRFAIGYDASKDWECSDIKEINEVDEQESDNEWSIYKNGTYIIYNR